MVRPDLLAAGNRFRKFLVEGARSLMLVTALAPVIGYDNAFKIAHHAMDCDLTLKQAALVAAGQPASSPRS